MHALKLLFGNAPHLGLAGGLAAGAAWLLTRHNRGFKVEARVIGSLRLAGVLLVVSAGSLFVAVGIGEPHGRVTDVSMLVLAASGAALLRAGCAHRRSAGSVSKPIADISLVAVAAGRHIKRLIRLRATSRMAAGPPIAVPP